MTDQIAPHNVTSELDEREAITRRFCCPTWIAQYDS